MTKRKKITKKQKVKMTKMFGKRKEPSKYEKRYRKRQTANRKAGLSANTPSPIRWAITGNKED